MRLIHVRFGEVTVVGGDERDVSRIGQGDQAGLDGGLHRQPVAMQFLDGAAGERLRHGVEQAFGFGFLARRRAGVRSDPWCRRSAAAGRRRVRRYARNGSCGFRVGSVSRKPSDDRRWRLAMPVASWASSTSGSGGRRGVVAGCRSDSAIWQPMMGWMPLPAQYCENSRAPNRLPVSVIAAAGMFSRLRHGGDLVGPDRALAERVGGMGAQMDEVSMRHTGRVSEAVELGQGPVPSSVASGEATA